MTSVSSSCFCCRGWVTRASRIWLQSLDWYFTLSPNQISLSNHFPHWVLKLVVRLHLVYICGACLFMVLQSFTDIWDWLLFSCWVAYYGESLISVFQGFYASIGGILIFGGGLGARLSFYGVKALSWCFLIS